MDKMSDGKPSGGMSGGMDMSAHNNMAMGPISFDCQGNPWSGMGPDRPGEWWIFFWAGLIMVIWSMHWTIAIFRRYLKSTTSTRNPYRTSTTFPVHRKFRETPVEGILKASVSLLGICCLMAFSHPKSPRVCGRDTPRAGHLSPDALYVSENIWILFSFALSGAIDVIAHYATLPQNMEHAFLACAFGLQAFLLRKEQHADMLDKMSLLLLFYAVAATTLSLVAEMVLPESFWAGCARVFSAWMQAIWYLSCAHILYGGYTTWSTTNPPDMAPGMFVPVVFVGFMNGLGITLLFIFLSVRWWTSHNTDGYEHVRLLNEKASTGVQLGKLSKARP